MPKQLNRRAKLLKPHQFGQCAVNTTPITYPAGTEIEVLAIHGRNPLHRLALVKLAGRSDNWKYAINIDTNDAEPIGDWYWDPKNKRNHIPDEEKIPVVLKGIGQIN